jgi:hypothetical protein
MHPTIAYSWTDANQRYMMARLAIVREALTRHAAHAQDAAWPVPPAAETESLLCQAAEVMPAPAALDSLCAAFVLSPFERDVLLLCAGMELDAAFSSLCATAQGNQQRPWPTFSLALASLAEAHWSALTPAAPLRRWRLIEVGAGETLTTSPLRIDERVLHYLTGVSYLDTRLRGLVEPQPSPTELSPSHRALAERIAQLWSHSKPEVGAWPVIYLGGDERVGKRAVAAGACAALGLQLHVLRAADVPLAVAEREALARLWEREAVLLGSALLLEYDEMENQREEHLWLDYTQGMFLVASRGPLRLWQRQMTRVEVNKPSAAEQHRLWRESLGTLAPQLDGQLEQLVSQFDLGLAEIQAASSQLASSLIGEDKEELGLRLWDACRQSARSRLDDLAQRIEPVAGWEELVLPVSQLETLREIAAQVRQRAQVYEAWGFAAKGQRGLGISALFTGTSGTGKTMAAEVLARELRLDLYRIDLSQVVSKYIGETEKNLQRLFDAAEAGGAVLLFDEADALFGKRSEVKDSHDRYANIEISYLLQRMESYRGLTILTTNLKNVLDPAFLRRIRFIVQFPFPDVALRTAIWRTIFPARTPTEHLDVHKLARLSVAGGNIRNIALHAAFLAADVGEPVRMQHLVRAAHSEYAKLEKPLTESEVRDWI